MTKKDRIRNVLKARWDNDAAIANGAQSVIPDAAINIAITAILHDDPTLWSDYWADHVPGYTLAQTVDNAVWGL